MIEHVRKVTFEEAGGTDHNSFFVLQTKFLTWFCALSSAIAIVTINYR